LEELNDILLQPAPEPEPLISKEFIDSYTNFRPDNDEITEQDLNQKFSDYLSTDEFLPKQNYFVMQLDTINNKDISRNIYSLQIFPCQYNPFLKILKMYKTAHVKVFFTPDDSGKPQEQPDQGSRGSREDEPEAKIEYLILTTEQLMDELQPLAAWKQRKGLATQIVDIQTIYNNESFDGYDEPEELRNFIMYAHKNLSTGYVLLAGDYDSVPPRMCHDPDPYAGADDGEIPSDSYYACISEGTTWDTDEDHIYGELGDLDDIYPDIIVGRIAINHEQKMADWVEEVINYETEPVDENWTDKVILIGPNVHNQGDGAKQNEYFYNNYLKFIYNDFDKFYEDSENGNKEFSKTEIVNSINYGTTFLNYLGHGGPTTWTYNYGYNSLMNKNDVNRFQNGGKKPVVYAMSCLTQWFDDPSDSGYGNFGDCIGETFTENVEDAGIGYIGSARTSVGIVGYGYQPFATGLQEDFIRQLSQYNFGLGSAFTEGKKHYSESFGNRFTDTNSNGEVQACWLEVNLLGEPELSLWTKRPDRFNITNESTDNILKLIVRNESGSPVKNAKVALQNSDHQGIYEVLQVKETSTNGEVIFQITGMPEKLNLTITKTNFIPYLERVTIADKIAPITEFEITPAIPDGENDWYITQPLINLSINEDGTSYYYWDDEPEQQYTDPIAAPEGEHILNYYSVDISNNIELPQSLMIRVDITKPLSILELDPAEPNGYHSWYTVQPIINIVIETGATAFYAFDDDLNLTFNNPIIAPVGIHDLHYYSKDIAGNKGETKTITIKVDIIPPKTELDIAPGSPTGSNDWYLSPPEISFFSEEDSETYYYWLADGVNHTDTMPIPKLYNNITITTPEGKNTLYYYSVDYAGCRERNRTYNFKVDTTPPKTQHEIMPELPNGENDFYTSDTYITLISEPNSILYYNWDFGQPVKYSKPILAIEGINSFSYYSVDEAGNMGEPISIELKVDTVPPATKLILDPVEPSGNNDWYDIIPIVQFKTEPEAVVFYQFEDYGYTTAPEQLEPLEGENKLYYYSIDAAGNKGPVDSQIIKIDITPPIAKISTEESTFYKDDTVIFYTEKSYDNNNILSYNFDFGDGETSGWVNTPTIKHQYQTKGEYEVILKVRDEAGLENEMGESIEILIKEEIDESKHSYLDGVSLMIILIVAIFFVLTISFIVTYRRFSAPVKARSLTMSEQAQTIAIYNDEEIGFNSTYDSDDIGVGIGPGNKHKIPEAIILNKPVVYKLNKIKCPGCGSIFIGEKDTDKLTCPSCGLAGKLPTNGKSSSKKQSHSMKYKCPECKVLFKTAAKEGYIRCPSCGIKGKV
jgi:DNA-directed RNA polymerase subunit RPC12/RpoP